MARRNKQKSSGKLRMREMGRTQVQLWLTPAEAEKLSALFPFAPRTKAFKILLERAIVYDPENGRRK